MDDGRDNDGEGSDDGDVGCMWVLVLGLEERDGVLTWGVSGLSGSVREGRK